MQAATTNMLQQHGDGKRSILADKQKDCFVASVQELCRFSFILEHLSSGQDLSAHMVKEVFTLLLEGLLSPAQMGALLLGLHAKGESSLEVTVAAETVLSYAHTPALPTGEYIDIVGTGGDGKNSFNCSTATALVLAGLGHKVVKHGNRSLSSKCGSADVLEQLGVCIHTRPEHLCAAIQNKNFVFLLAPLYHPAFAHVAQVRKELGVRTIFNLLGPLVNPAAPNVRLLGVGQHAHLALLADALATFSSGRHAVVYGAGGYDEVTPLGVSQIFFVHDGRQSFYELDPQEYGMASCTPEDLQITNKAEAKAVLLQLLAGKGSQAMLDMLVLNVGLALHLLQKGNMHECMEQAKIAVYSGKGKEGLYA